MGSSAHHGGKIREEPAMATITFDTANRKEHVREPRETVRPTAAITRQGERPGIVPAEQPAAVSAQFQPLDPDIVNEAVPAFFIGRNKEGFWIARDVKGRFGGIFLFRYSALAFARRKSRPAGCATIYPSERFELDLENRGNPMVRHIGSVIGLSRRPRRQLAGVIAKTKAAVKRRLKQLYAF
jgi:hypothetical protein